MGPEKGGVFATAGLPKQFRRGWEVAAIGDLLKHPFRIQKMNAQTVSKGVSSEEVSRIPVGSDLSLNGLAFSLGASAYFLVDFFESLTNFKQ